MRIPATATTTLLAIILAFASSTPARAQQEAKAAVVTAVDEMIEVLYGSSRSSSAAEQEKRVRAALGKRFSFDAFVYRSLGKNKDKLSSKELARVGDLTVALMVRTYVRQFAGSGKPSVAYGNIVDLGNHRAELKSAVTIGGKRYGVIYRVAKMQNGWQVYDIVIEGASLVANYRKQFDAHFRKGSASQLVAKLEKQLAG